MTLVSTRTLKYHDIMGPDGHRFVYVWMRGKKVLYVGSAANLSSRFANHHVINKVERVLSRDTFVVYEFDNVQDAANEETRLQEEHSPKHCNDQKRRETRRAEFANHKAISEQRERDYYDRLNRTPVGGP